MPTVKRPAILPAGYLSIAIALLGCAVFYLWLRGAPADAPRLLLAPIARLSGFLCDIPFAFVPGSGYCGYTRDGTLLIVEKSCSGGNFLVILFSLLAITQLPRARRNRQLPLLLPGLFLFSLVGAVLAAALRIAASIPLLALSDTLSPVLLHNIAGIGTYLTAICLLYLAARQLVSLLLPQASLPERTVPGHG